MKLPIKELLHLGIRSMETGNFIPFGMFLVFIYTTWPMDATQRMHIIESIVQSPWFAGAGWTAFLVSLIFHRSVVNFRERKHTDVVKQLEDNHAILVKKQLELPLTSKE